LPVGEKREGQQRAADRQGGGRQQGAGAVGGGGHALLGHRERQHGDGSGHELHCGHRDRVAATQQTSLRDGERGGQQQRREHEAIAVGRRATSAAADQADACQ